jgi:hypothetical protein
MIPLGMVMRNIFAQRPPQGALAKENVVIVILLGGGGWYGRGRWY